MVRDVCSKGGQDCPIEALDLTIRLGMVGRSERIMYRQYLTDVLEESGCELTPVICYYFGWWAVCEYPFVLERLCNGRSGDASKGYGSHEFCEPVCDNEEPSVSPRGLAQLSEYVYTY